MPAFYELQLIYFTTFCVVFLLVERQLSSRKQSKIPNGDLAAPAAASSGSGNVLSKLTRQYLIVYAIVMGESQICLLRISKSGLGKLTMP